MSVISTSFKKHAAQKTIKSLGVSDEKITEQMVDVWMKGFELAESMFTEQV